MPANHSIQFTLPLLIMALLGVSFSHSLHGQTANIFGDVREAHDLTNFMSGVKIFSRKKESSQVAWITQVVTSSAKPGEFNFQADIASLTKPDSILLKFEKKRYKTLKGYYPINQDLNILLSRRNTKKNTLKYGGIGLLVAGAVMEGLSRAQYEKHKNFNNGFLVRDKAFENANLFRNIALGAGGLGLSSLCISFTVRKY